MDGIIEEHVVTDRIERDEKEYGQKRLSVSVPRGKNLFCHLVFLFIGICHFLPMTFFSAANNYWMYVFRDTSSPDDSPENRTFMQRNYASATMIISTIPMLVFGVLNITHAHRFKIMKRLIWTLVIELFVFAYVTVSTRIDTDNYQVIFFATILLGNAILSGCNSINMVASMNLYPRFPMQYMKTCLIGEGLAGVVGDLLNLLTIYSFSGQIKNSTFMYFCFGSLVILFTIVLSLVAANSVFFKHCLESMPQDAERSMPTAREMTRIVGKIRLIILLMASLFVGMSATHPSITALVVSEQGSTTSSWSKNWFSPVMTFLLGDVGMLIGRFISAFLPYKPTNNELFIFAILRTLIFVPCVWLCNAQPRKHLPVIFPHDYQYGLIFGFFMVANGYIMNISSLYISEKIDKKDVDLAYTVFGLTISMITTLASPIGMFIVNVL